MTDPQLTHKRCIPCEGGVPTATKEQIQLWLPQVPGWEVVTTDGINRLRKSFIFKDFVGSMEFVKKVAAIAEAEGHHPDIHIFYNTVQLENWTHAIGGLHENDFILAAKINALLL